MSNFMGFVYICKCLVHHKKLMLYANYSICRKVFKKKKQY
jgi:hypothetical protein